MILTCPNCYSQFKVALAVIGNSGRNVRCSACREVWYEDDHVVESVKKDVGISENEDIEESDVTTTDDDTLEIPDSIKPLKNYVHSEADNKDNNQEKKIAYGMAACLFLVILVYLLLSSTSMMRSYPSMQAFYALFSIHMDLPASDKVTFANIKANDVDGVIKVSGDIINLTRKPQALGMMEITMSDGSEQIAAQWFATPPKVVLDQEETVKFISEHHLEQSGDHGETEHEGDDEHRESETAHHDDTHAVVEGNSPEHNKNKYVRIRFVLNPALNISPVKTDEEGGENNSTPHESESDHQNGHGASL